MKNAVWLSLACAGIQLVAAPLHAQGLQALAPGEMSDSANLVTPLADDAVTAAQAPPSSAAAFSPLPSQSVGSELALGSDEILSDNILAENRGGEAMIVSNQTLKAITSGNVLTGDYIAGAVTVSDGAFSSFTGLGNIAINTGAQVSLQSGVNVIINVGQ